MSTYTVVIPDTWRAGPGHRSHLSPDGGKTTLCKVENNARGLDPLPREWAEPGDVAHCEQAIRRWWPARKLCGNCQQLARRRDP